MSARNDIIIEKGYSFFTSLFKRCIMKSWHGNSGVTFMELLVVLTIAGILSALAIPKIGPMVELIKLRTAANSVKRQIIVARTRALSDPTIHVGVYIDRRTNPNKSFVFFDNNPPNNKFDLGEPVYMGYFIPPKGIRDSIPPGSDSVVVFRGDGSAKNPATFIVKNRYDKIRTIGVLPSTGRVKIQ
jgi:prepilin-type N-terminal cleavage/methylation domain-containing protein